jgi:3-oxoacyl-[acyl-carrier-protein] synthase II
MRGGSVGSTEGGALYFPYTAPSAVPAEVAIEYGLTGGYVILVGGAAAAVDALWQAGTLLAAGRADRALVLAVETFDECGDLWARGRWTTPRPLVEAAACAVLAGDGDGLAYGPGGESTLEKLAARRAGETLACAPLIGLALARAAGVPLARVTGQWRGRRAQVAFAT